MSHPAPEFAPFVDDPTRSGTETTGAAHTRTVVQGADSVMVHILPEIVGPAPLYVDLWIEADFFDSGLPASAGGEAGPLGR